MTATDPAFIADLAARVAGEVRAGASLARFSTYRIGGPATVVLPASEQDVVVALQHAATAGVPVFPLGLGSNLLFPDEGLDALVVRLGKGLDHLRSEAERWWLGAGLPAPLAARKTAQQGWAGLHLMVGVPGTVGGGVYMNAGCHGGQWADVVARVRVAGADGEVRTVERGAIPFAYRQSGLTGVVVLEVEVVLARHDPAALDTEVERLFAWRQAGTPFNQACCGSVFKNPAPPAPEGWDRPWTAGSVIEAAGLKGIREGGALVSPMHANYVVNTGGATAQEVGALIHRVRDTVQARFGVSLDTEVKLIDRWGSHRHV